MKTVIEMAREAGLHSAVLVYIYGKESALCDSEIDELRRLERFAALVRADECEQCLHAAEVAASLLNDPIAAIRARGSKT